MPIAPGIYTINSVAEKGPLYYDPSGDSFIVGTQGTKFYISKVGDVHTIQSFQEGSYAHINVQPPGYPLVIPDGQEPFLWQFAPTDADPNKYNIIVNDGDYKGRGWTTDRLGGPPPIILVDTIANPAADEQLFTFTPA